MLREPVLAGPRASKTASPRAVAGKVKVGKMKRERSLQHLEMMVIKRVMAVRLLLSSSVLELGLGLGFEFLTFVLILV